VIASILGCQSQAIYIMDKIVRMDAAGPYGADAEMASTVLTGQRIAQILLFVGLAVVLSSVSGLVASSGRHKGFAGGYVVSSLACSGIMLVTAAQVWQRKAVVEPIIARQADVLCNSTEYVQLATGLGCSWADEYSKASCGQSCVWKVELLAASKACGWLPILCKAFLYEALPASECATVLGALPASSVPFFAASESTESCRQACDSDIVCTQFYSSTVKPLCLQSGLVDEHPAPKWTVIQPSQVTPYVGDAAPVNCYRRTEPDVNGRFQVQTTRLAASTLLLAVLLTVSSTCAFGMMYNLNHRRKGKPKASQLGLMMCCPCCASRLHRRFNKPEISDESSSGDGEAW